MTTTDNEKRRIGEFDTLIESQMETVNNIPNELKQITKMDWVIL